MPRYFFHTRIGADVIADPDGITLRDADHAWNVAQSMARGLLSDATQRPQLMAACVEVRDEDGEIVLEFPFSEIVAAMPGQSRLRH